jgi:hypothetical protein
LFPDIAELLYRRPGETGQFTRPLLKSDIIKIDMAPASARSINEGGWGGPGDKLGDVPPDPFHRFGAFSGSSLDHLTIYKEFNSLGVDIASPADQKAEGLSHCPDQETQLLIFSHSPLLEAILR